MLGSVPAHGRVLKLGNLEGQFQPKTFWYSMKGFRKMSKFGLDEVGGKVVKQREFREGLNPWRTNFPEKESEMPEKSIQGISHTKYISGEKENCNSEKLNLVERCNKSQWL